MKPKRWPCWVRSTIVGIDVVQDDGRACRYLRRAAEMGSPKGQYLYGELLFKGEGTESKVLEALEWLDKAAAQNYPRAVDTQAKFDAFVTFDPSRGLVEGSSR